MTKRGEAGRHARRRRFGEEARLDLREDGVGGRLGEVVAVDLRRRDIEQGQKPGFFQLQIHHRKGERRAECAGGVGERREAAS